MTKWIFRTWRHDRREIAVRSADHAVELLMEYSGWSEYGVILEFVHDEGGLISCIANNEFSTIEFNPDFNATNRSPSRRRQGIRLKPVGKDPFCFVDNVGVASSISLRYVLPIIKVTRAVKHIIEHHDFPGGIRWSNPLLEET